MEKETVEVFNVPWHIAHQYELVRIPNTHWSWLAQHRRKYSSFPRGDYFTEYNMKWVPHFEDGKYDFALLHLDQQCFEDGIADRGKGSLFFEVKSVVEKSNTPMVCIMHGTPFYPESFPSDITEENYKDLGYTKDQINMSSELINRFLDAIKGFDYVIFNSKTAQRQWVGDSKAMEFEGTDKITKFKTIWHGMDESEWWNLPKEPRVVTMISPAGLDKYYDRALLAQVKTVLAERDIEHCHITVDASFKNFDEYRNFLGRSLIYFNPTKESCMPRSRAEAMFSGCCIISMPGQDVDEFIENGENGIIFPKRDPQFIADVIEGLIFDYKKAVELGQKGRETAKEIFTLDRFHDDWADVIKDVTGKQVK